MSCHCEDLAQTDGLNAHTVKGKTIKALVTYLPSQHALAKIVTGRLRGPRQVREAPGREPVCPL